MKALGMYLSGSISFGVCPNSGKAVEYRERIHQLTPQQREMYNRAAAAWQSVLRNIDAALEVTNGGPRARAVALNKFWGDHQRFFRQVICAFKVPSVIAETEAALSECKSVVISLVGTGEARTKEQVAKATADGLMLEDLDFSPREVIAAMVDRGFDHALSRRNRPRNRQDNPSARQRWKRQSSAEQRSLAHEAGSYRRLVRFGIAGKPA